MYIVFMYAVFVYLDEQVASKTELDQEPEHHASKHQLNDVPDASYSCICSILNLKFMITVYLMLHKHSRGSNIHTVLVSS